LVNGPTISRRFDETSTRQPMKIQHFVALVVLSLAPIPGARAAVLVGPITNAASGRTYARGRVEVDGTVISEILPRRL